MDALRAPTRPLRTHPYTAIAMAALAAIVVVRIAREVVEGETLAFDTHIMEAIHAASTPPLVALAWFFTDLGPPVGITVVVAIAAFVLWRRGWVREAAIFVAGFALSSGLVTILKLTFDRARPDLWPRPHVSGDSFPSGHAVSSVLVYGALAVLAGRADPARRTLYSAAATLLIAGIALSRAVLGVHWPTDLIAGLSLGVVLLVVTIAAIDRWGTPTAPWSELTGRTRSPSDRRRR